MAMVSLNLALIEQLICSVHPVSHSQEMLHMALGLSSETDTLAKKTRWMVRKPRVEVGIELHSNSLNRDYGFSVSESHTVREWKETVSKF
jgi:hypothetical protein